MSKRTLQNSETEKRPKSSKRVCVFCLSAEQDDLRFGEILTKDGVTCHYFCLLLASGLFQNGPPKSKSSIKGFLLSDIRCEVKRGLRLKCYYCHEKGATLGCCEKKCKKTFHLPCGRKNGTLHQFYGGFGSFCDEHRPRQTLRVDNCENNEEVSCSICLSPLSAELSSIDVFHSSCCNHGWFHHGCIQKYAISAGKHHFRCPLCNCRKKFHDEMQRLGIYLPDQDASWERQRGAFQDLLHRHNTCDADICRCPFGRNHDAVSGKYDLILCSSCGSFGSHRACRALTWHDSALVCPVCASVAKEYAEKKTTLKNRKTSVSESSGYKTTNAQVRLRARKQTQSSLRLRTRKMSSI